MESTPPLSQLRIILLEDDPLQAEWIVDRVLEDCEDCEFRYFDSEYSFIQAVESGAFSDWPPEIAIFDLRARYYSVEDLAEIEEKGGKSLEILPVKDLPEPTESGIRCSALIRRAVPNIKVAIATIMMPNQNNQNRFADKENILHKGTDEFIEDLKDFISAATEESS